MGEAEAARLEGMAERSWVNKREMGLQGLHGRERSRADSCFGSGRKLQNNREHAARSNERKGVFEAAADAGVFEDKRGMDEIDGRQSDGAGGKIDAV